MASQLIAASILGALIFLPWYLVIRLLRVISARRSGSSAVSGTIAAVGTARRPRLVWPV